jgi:hypothetical protein
MCPVVLGTAGKLVFEVVVKPFHQAITLRMVCHCLVVLDVQQVAQGGPQGEGQLL